MGRREKEGGCSRDFGLVRIEYYRYDFMDGLGGLAREAEEKE